MNSSSKSSKVLSELLKKNTTCADCGSPDLTHASYNIGIFICSTCASIHSTLGSHISKVKHLNLDHWEESQVERLKQVGNVAARQKYEQKVPSWFQRPKDSNLLLLQHWIYAKYVRNEFSSTNPTYLTGVLDGFLMKKMREDGRYFPRRFILENGTMCYFVENKTPKAVIQLTDVSVSLCPAKLGKEASLQIDHMTNGSTRHLYVCHNDGNVICQWYYAIIAGKAAIREVNEPIEIEGYLWKAGPSPSYAHRKRWFTLAGRKLMYHSDVLDAYPKGEVFLGHMPEYRVSLGGFGEEKDNRLPFTLNTPTRTFILSTENPTERDRWIQKLTAVVSREMTPKDVKLCETLVRKKNGKKMSILK